MSEALLPTHRTRRISLTKSQLRTELGAELLSLCESITADGKLAFEEAQGLREWIEEVDTADLPAATYLRANESGKYAGATFRSPRRTLWLPEFGTNAVAK